MAGPYLWSLLLGSGLVVLAVAQLNDASLPLRGSLDRRASSCPGRGSSYNYTCALNSTTNYCENDQTLPYCGVGQLFLTSYQFNAVSPAGEQWFLTNNLVEYDTLASPTNYKQVLASNFSTSGLLNLQTLSFGNKNIDLSVYTTPGNYKRSFTFQNVTQTPIANIARVAGTPELVPNGGFETGVLKPWQIVLGAPSYKIVSPGLAGSKYLFNISANPDNGTAVGLRTYLATQPGSRYLLSLSYLNNQPSSQVTNTITIQLGPNQLTYPQFADGATKYTQFNMQLDAISSSPRNPIFPFIALAKQTPLTIVVGVVHDPSQWVAIDSISFKLAK